MENIRNTYEVLFALSLKNGEETAQATSERLKGLIEANAEIVAVDVWGKRRLAYPINYEKEGYYVLIYFRSAPDFTAELTRVLGITEDALRFIVLAVDEKKQTISVRGSAPEVIGDDEDEDEAPAEPAKAEEAPAEAAEEAEAPAEETPAAEEAPAEAASAEEAPAAE